MATQRQKVQVGIFLLVCTVLLIGTLIVASGWQREATIPAAAKARLTEALERLVQLAQATGRHEQAAKWRKELEARQQR